MASLRMVSDGLPLGQLQNTKQSICSFKYICKHQLAWLPQVLWLQLHPACFWCHANTQKCVAQGCSIIYWSYNGSRSASLLHRISKTQSDRGKQDCQYNAQRLLSEGTVHPFRL